MKTVASDPDLGATWRSQPRRSLKVSHLLAADLRRQILRGDLAVGRQLPPEAELTATLGVSRDTVREALRILESQSLVEIRLGRGGGAVVRRPGLESVGQYVALLLQLHRTTLADLEEARSVIEPAAAELLAVRCGDEDLDRLASFHERELDPVGDALSFVGAMAMFDQAVAELGGNSSIGVVAGVLREIYVGQAYAVVDASDHETVERIASTVIAGHEAYLDAARRHDGASAKETWREYLTATGSLVAGGRSRQPIDVVPLWRAKVKRPGGEQRQRMATVVATEIRSRIAEGRLGDGERLAPLAELASEFSISRPTLREALRILEMEFLIDLRTGDRGGARVRHPSTQIAAQLAGTIFEARRTTIADFHRALRLVEPTMMEVTASGIDATSLEALRVLQEELAGATEDIPRFVTAWTRAKELAFAATRNPALSVVAQLLQWVRLGAQPTVAADAAREPPWVENTRRMAELFGELVSALAAADGHRAAATWDALGALHSPFIESSDLGRRLVVELID